MRLTLFGSPGSGSAAIEMALLAARVEFDRVHASSWEAVAGRKQLLALNPLGQIPTLVLLDGTVLTESAAILISLGLQYPKAELLPRGAADRALAIRGLVFIAANCYAAISIGDYPQRWTTSDSTEAHLCVRSAARTQLHRSWDIFADTFDTASVLSFHKPGSLAFLAVVVSQWSGARQHIQVSRPAFFQTLMHLEEHPAISPVLREHRRS